MNTNPLAWWRGRRERQAVQAYTEGYRTAAGALLAGNTIEQLRAAVMKDRIAGVFTPYDRGVEQACTAWQARLRTARKESGR